MVLRAEVETFKVIHWSSSGTKNFLIFKFGLNLLKDLELEWETLFPDIAFLPVKSQIFDMSLVLISNWAAKMLIYFFICNTKLKELLRLV